MSEAPEGSASPPVDPVVTLEDKWNEAVQDISNIVPRKYRTCSRAAVRRFVEARRKDTLSLAVLILQKTRTGKVNRYRSRESKRL